MLKNKEQKNAGNAAIKGEKLRGALKLFISRERKRKKEEFEAKIEEERLRKEYEARERQNDMTLEETRGQITKLDQKLTELRTQKQQLFLQLKKKMLNEDEARKKQQKDNELYAIQQASIVPQQIYMPSVRLPPHQQMPLLTKPIGNQPIKRGRSPSPTHHGYYKSGAYTSKHDDGRRSNDYARVLWNKPPTPYQNPGTLFYQTSSNAPPQQSAADNRPATVIYPAYNNIRQSYHLELQPTSAVTAVSKAEQVQKPAQIYHINLDKPTIAQAAGPLGVGQSPKPQITMEKINDRYHLEVKHDGAPPPPPGHGPSHQLSEGVVFTPLIPGIAMHPNVMQITSNLSQTAKAGSGIVAQNFQQGRVSGPSHEQLARQQQLSVLTGQPGQQPHYRYHL